MTDAIHKKLAHYRKAAETAPTFTGTAQSPDLCPCLDGTSTCRYRRLDGGMLWDCQSCRREWIVPDAHHVEEDVGYWGSLLVAAAIIGSGLLLAIGFGGGWLARGWWA